MRELTASGDDVDIEARLGADERPKPDGRPWVTLVMIASLDGAIVVNGVSGGLGSAADQRRFLAARRQADAIVVGATTARLEDYQPTTVPIAVITGSLSLEPAARLFGDPERKPLLFTKTQAARTEGDRFVGIAEVVTCGDSIEPVDVLADLDHRGIASVVLEGGPTLNGQFLEHDVVDEILLTVSPVAASGESPRLAHGASLDKPRRFMIDRVLSDDNMLFVRYLRQR